MSNVLNDHRDLLLFESDTQGEESLRYEISKYVYSSRGVKCDPDQIVIAAGTQQITSHLARILQQMGISHVAVEDRGGIRYYGSISIEDTIKPCSIAAVSRLAAAGVKRTVMLTGDRKVIADKIARIVGISEVHSELLPADKVAIAEGIIGGKALNGNGSGSGGNTGFSRSGKVAFVGDGINDAPVLARADVGIAMPNCP